VAAARRQPSQILAAHPQPNIKATQRDGPLFGLHRSSPSLILEMPDRSLCGAGRGWKRLGADGGGRLEAVPLDQPSSVIGLAKVEQGLAELLDGLEGLHPEQVLLQGSDEALDTSQRIHAR
jgi:hypothetical protein